VLARAGKRGQERRLEDAAAGRTTWKTAPEVVKYQNRQENARKMKEKQEREAANSDGARDAEAEAELGLDTRLTHDYLKQSLMD
jgi:hypothetical protein